MGTRASIDLRELEVFLAVYELRSMTAAAKKLSLTQPAVSASIRQLEKKLDTPLIDRSKRPLKPTMAGHWLHGSAYRVVDGTRQIPIAMRSLSRGSSVRLRVGLIDCLSHPFASLMVKRLKSSIHYLSVSSGLARNLRAGLVERSLDLIITNDHLDGLKGITRRPLLQEPYFLVVPRKYRTYATTNSMQEIIKELPLIRWSPHSNIGAQVELHLRRMGIEAPQKFEFESSSSIIGTVASGLGCAIVTPLLLSGTTHILGHVAVVPFPGPKFSRQIDLVTRTLEIDALADRITCIALEILRKQYQPLLLKLAPVAGGWSVFG